MRTTAPTSRFSRLLSQPDACVARRIVWQAGFPSPLQVSFPSAVAAAGPANSWTIIDDLGNPHVPVLAVNNGTYVALAAVTLAAPRIPAAVLTSYPNHPGWCANGRMLAVHPQATYTAV